MRALLALALIALSACGTIRAVANPEPEPERWSIVIHGGAGVIDRTTLTPGQDAAYRAAMRDALTIGGNILESGGTSLDAVTATISYLEDNELFNAGRGAVFSAEGRNELDASIMDGSTRAAGAVAGMTRTRHPILAARAVMEHSPHVMLVGEGAETFARTQNLEEVAPSYFFTERRWQQLDQYLRANNLPVPARPEGAPPAPQGYHLEGADDHQFGTVGVVAYDSRGNIAAGTSTGGMTGKRWGRVGDAPIIGAGTYAQNGVCGVSATGSGEYFIRAGVARAICARMELNSDDADDAANLVMREVGEMGGSGGVIVIDGNGRYAWVMNTPGMYRGQLRQGGYPLVQIFADEDD
ncbi:isoaspartyl peptidase/L-asparaginase family protein [Terricaulis silvestris]|uniref:Isoaspartyl peptidase n=1 Tax=Terricaulis silvestris TaxID=2686094 RepID=A0A6I6MQN1_9CAUL|nr:isoaspartyl peptidase/L-asparaginase [Terricaulis silvestris]QGZ93493.1 Isoaspartyl peptidase precursor [Terricaulis silvestris]